MPSIIADASVILKWYALEDDSDKADILLSLVESEEAKLVLPQATLLELLNALKLSKDFSKEEIEEALDKFHDLNIEWAGVDKEYTLDILTAMFNHNLASYDAAFVALAIAKDIPLITADYKHHRKEISGNIIWLSEWKGKL